MDFLFEWLIQIVLEILGQILAELVFDAIFEGLLRGLASVVSSRLGRYILDGSMAFGFGAAWGAHLNGGSHWPRLFGSASGSEQRQRCLRSCNTDALAMCISDVEHRQHSGGARYSHLHGDGAAIGGWVSLC
ncbi:MAG: hypothetical protein ACJ735_00470 [Actinomycetes bacterium]